MDNMYLDNLEEFIADEQKIVTYKWLSLTLNIGANVAKQMLYHYVDQQLKSEKRKLLHVTYLVSGIMERGKGLPDALKVMVVREDKLEDIKSKMKTVVSVHVYSVQAADIKDLNVLYAVDYDKVKEQLITSTKYSGINCEEAQVKSQDDLQQLQLKSAYKPPPDPEKSSTKGTIKGPNSMNNKSSGKSAGIASMFMNQAKKTEVKKSPIKSEPSKKSPEVEKKKKPQQGAMSAFLSKGPPAKKIKVENTDTSSKPSITSTSPTKAEENQKVATPKEEPMEITKSSPKEHKTYSKKNKTSTTNKSSKFNKLKKESEEPIPKNKRKRIMQLSDSESSDGNESGEDESPLPSTPPPATLVESDEEVIQATPQEETKVNLTSKSGRCRKMKQVVKTFTDEDGFLITKKEFECVSGSESEDEIATKKTTVKVEKKVSPIKEAKQQTKKKTKSPTNKSTTQSSITSFFKKK